jgi:hypothetical protein
MQCGKEAFCFIVDQGSSAIPMITSTLESEASDAVEKWKEMMNMLQLNQNRTCGEVNVGGSVSEKT